MNNIIHGNILDIEFGVITHQVNCQKVAGAGLAKQIAGKWPEWLSFYKNSTQILGDATTFRVEPGIIVASLYGQNRYGRGKRYTEYQALQKAMETLYKLRDAAGKSFWPIYIPHGIGCGLAGGDWNIVSELIWKTIPDAIIVKRIET